MQCSALAQSSVEEEEKAKDKAEETAAKKAAENSGALVLDEIVVLSADEQLKQAPGVSIITAEDIRKQPPANDLSEIIRRMPGVNLTGTSASGQRGNNRQIDIRGMGPENTLVLIDGKPVLSRNSVRMGRAGERDSRGDTNWIPAEAVERIEVLRGPAAARYGSGASGGVVNIITKRPEDFTTTLSAFASVPQHGEEGGTQRANALIAGPINDIISFRFIGNVNKTDADDPDINADATLDPAAVPAAGREGVRNVDLRGLLSFEVDPAHRIDVEAAYSRQGNIYTGDRQLSSSTDLIEELADEGEETNVLQRTTLSLTHDGKWDFGDSLSFIQWEHTTNERMLEGLAGGGEGAINSTETGTITLDDLIAKSEWNIPLAILFDQTMTLGGEFRGEWMHDGISIGQSIVDGVEIPGTEPDPEQRDPDSDAWLAALFVEDNILVTDRLTLTPGLRFDYHSSFGENFSPSLNASYDLTPSVSIKAGIARAFKAPNLFQLNPNYVYYTRGNGCPVGYPQTNGIGCYVVGNPDLEPETSINKEIGINYHPASGLNAGLTFFHNDYENRIATGMVPIDVADPDNDAGWYFRWENVPEAVVSGLEGNLLVPLGERLTFSANATYMLQSEDKSNGQPLSLVPEYTINAAIDWQVRDDLSLRLSATHYGKTESPEITATTGNPVDNPLDRDPYTIVNVGLNYAVNETFSVSAGVTNLFDERLFREGSGNAAGANTYNEPGRAFYLSGTATF